MVVVPVLVIDQATVVCGGIVSAGTSWLVLAASETVAPPAVIVAGADDVAQFVYVAVTGDRAVCEGRDREPLTSFLVPDAQRQDGRAGVLPAPVCGDVHQIEPQLHRLVARV